MAFGLAHVGSHDLSYPPGVGTWFSTPKARPPPVPPPLPPPPAITGGITGSQHTDACAVSMEWKRRLRSARADPDPLARQAGECAAGAAVGAGGCTWRQHPRARIVYGSQAEPGGGGGEGGAPCTAGR
jgi:hypothetical protein